MTAASGRETAQAQLASAWADFAQGRVAQAEAALRRLAADEPRLGTSLHLLAAMRWQHDAANAEIWLRRVLALDPLNVSALNALAATLKSSGRPIAALRWLRMAAAVQPDEPATLANLANMPGAVALSWCRRALLLNPGNVDLILERHAQLLVRGRAQEAAKLLDSVSDGSDHRLQAARICTAYLLEDAGPAQFLDLVRSFDEHFARPLGIGRAPNIHRRRRKLRIGYVAGDSFRLHTAAFTLLPTIEHHDPETVEVFCYSDVPASRQDSITERFIAASTGFRHTLGLDDSAFAAAIAADEIDVVIDSLGYPQGSRLLALARRPAPLRISWPPMGSIGSDMIDVVFGDRWTIPDGAERWFDERVVRLPLSLGYDPLLSTPEPEPRPSGGITFGSFNQLAKLSDRTIRLWSRILASVPDSCLVLKALGLTTEEIAGDLLARFERHWVDAGRIELRLPVAGFEGHLASYADIDIALDPTPYGGVITTLEAMWMGVPVVTLAGDRILGRYGLALVNAVGAPELGASDEDGYVAAAVELAADDRRRVAFRRELRGRMKASLLGNAKALAASVETAIRDLVER